MCRPSSSHVEETVLQVRSWFDKACPERTVRPFESLRANGESKDSPRTDHGILKINYLAVRPEHVEGLTASYDKLSRGSGKGQE
jgi:hypothetical protein